MIGAVGSHWKHDLEIVRFPPEGCAFSNGSRVGAVGSRRKNVYVLGGVGTLSDEELCAFLERGTRLASGAEWEPWGAGTKAFYVLGGVCVCAFRDRSRLGASRDGYK